MINVTPREKLVLYALHGKELYGLQIIEAIKESSFDKVEMGVGTLYPVLHSLESKGLALSSWDEGRYEGARRRYYKLTDEGNNVVSADQVFISNLLNWVPKYRLTDT